MTRAFVDSALAVQLHREGNRTVPQIAVHFGVQPPSIYKAFRKHGYFTPGMLENRKPREPRMYLPPAAGKCLLGRPIAAVKAVNALPIVNRDPCFRCGTRGDLGCKCNKGALGWHAG